MKLERRDCDGATLVTCLDDRLDAVIAVQFKDTFRELCHDLPSRCILDMSQVQFMDSSGLGAVVAVYKMLGQDAALDLVGLTPPVDRVMRLTRMDSVFAIYPDLDAALALPARRAG